jgi:hypothetical protein
LQSGARALTPKRMLRASAPNAINAVLAEVQANEDAYTEAVRRITMRGSQLHFELLIAPVDKARERTMQLIAAHAEGRATEMDVIETATALLRLMNLVIGEHGQTGH